MSDQGSYLDIKPDQGESKGALVGTIIVIILLIVGAIYVLATKSGLNSETASSTDTVATSADVSSLDANLATSTDINDIEKDLKSPSTSQGDLDKAAKDLGI